ncbi:Histone-lysine N-methyltransferase SETMAR [Eumeta japonica]|uniref:Histone-lysine N-methyltransferase SETMAR n=1 Tax=Eumeta variegata TaxID=151549 RepID=A0A4C1ZIP3_EUMVA|nr:Histone-lysine N-methyltransferase SETMAR [Eumeta japonica]
MRLKQDVEKKRPELINRKDLVFHHDNARPHTSLTTQQILREFGWKVLMHPLYSLDLASSDFHLIRSLQNSLSSVRLTSREEAHRSIIRAIAHARPAGGGRRPTGINRSPPNNRLSRRKIYGAVGQRADPPAPINLSTK